MIDFHCHIDLYPKPNEVVRECVKRGIYTLSVTTTPSAWQKTSDLATDVDAKRVRTALGFHPAIASERKSEITLFDNYISHTKYVGEIGLDGSKELAGTYNDQIDVFEHVLAKCQAVGGKILSIHSKHAARDVLQRIESHPHVGTPILHWYSGGYRDLEKAIALGCWFSIGPTMIYSDKGRLLISRMPKDRILTESDGPFAKLKGATLYPWDVEIVVRKLAEIWCLTEEQTQKQLWSNFRTLTHSKLESHPPLFS